MISMPIRSDMSEDDNIYLNPTIIRRLTKILGKSSFKELPNSWIEKLVDSSPGHIKAQVLDDIEEWSREIPLTRTILDDRARRWKCQCGADSYIDAGNHIVCKVCSKIYHIYT